MAKYSIKTMGGGFHDQAQQETVEAKDVELVLQPDSSFAILLFKDALGITVAIFRDWDAVKLLVDDPEA